jgi:hypothetical protein
MRNDGSRGCGGCHAWPIKIQNHNELVAEDGLAVSFEDDRNAYNADTAQGA